MVRLAKRLPCQHGGLNLDPKHPHDSRVWSHTSITLALEGAETDRTLVSQSSQPVYLEDMNQRGVWKGVTMFLLLSCLFCVFLD